MATWSECVWCNAGNASALHATCGHGICADCYAGPFPPWVHDPKVTCPGCDLVANPPCTGCAHRQREHHLAQRGPQPCTAEGCDCRTFHHPLAGDAPVSR